MDLAFQYGRQGEEHGARKTVDQEKRKGLDTVASIHKTGGGDLVSEMYTITILAFGSARDVLPISAILLYDISRPIVVISIIYKMDIKINEGVNDRKATLSKCIDGKLSV